jgi:hypothetical protein
MLIRWLPFLAGIVPLVAVAGAFWIGVANEVLPSSCIPFLDGCVSISAAGRKPPGSFLFRAVMLPQAVLLIIVWHFSVLWLRSLDSALRRSTVIAIMVSGIVGAIATIIYVTFLGTKEPIYEFMRRIGIYFGFLGAGVAQLIIAVTLNRIANALRHTQLIRLARVMSVIWLTAFSLGLLNVVLRSILEDSDQWENRIEWIVFIIMQCYFVVLYLAWRVTDFALSVSTRTNHS